MKLCLPGTSASQLLQACSTTSSSGDIFPFFFFFGTCNSLTEHVEYHEQLTAREESPAKWSPGVLECLQEVVFELNPEGLVRVSQVE